MGLTGGNKDLDFAQIAVGKDERNCQLDRFVTNGEHSNSKSRKERGALATKPREISAYIRGNTLTDCK